MMRILDLDLDFFLDRATHWQSEGRRLDAGDASPWSLQDVYTFLEERCGLDAPIPGGAFEEHDEVFTAWRDLIRRGGLRPPFHVTHVDAHADLGLGDPGYVYLMTELLFHPVEVRAEPKRGRWGMSSSNWLAFAIACRWLSDITYVYIPGGGSDLLSLHMEDYNPNGHNVQLKKIDPADESRLTSAIKPQPLEVEPRIPIRSVRAADFEAEAPFDLIFLARSPAFTPATSDIIYDAIRTRYIRPL